MKSLLFLEAILVPFYNVTLSRPLVCEFKGKYHIWNNRFFGYLGFMIHVQNHYLLPILSDIFLLDCTYITISWEGQRWEVGSTHFFYFEDLLLNALTITSNAYGMMSHFKVASIKWPVAVLANIRPIPHTIISHTHSLKNLTFHSNVSFSDRFCSRYLWNTVRSTCTWMA